MIRQYTRLRVADNTGARTLMCITIIGRSQSDTAEVGDVIVASVKQALPNSGVKKGEVVRAVVVRTAKEYGRPDGSHIRFDENAAHVGDTVRIEESRPLSRDKRWTMVEIVARGSHEELVG